MSALALELAKFSDPAPRIEDPEDDINVDTNAKLSGKTDEDNDIIHEVSSLRLKNAPLLHEFDERYAGKRISRKSLNKIEDEDDSNSEDEQESECSTNDDEIESFKKKISELDKRLLGTHVANELDEKDVSEDDSGSEHMEEEMEEEEDEELEEEEEEQEDEGAEGFMQKFSSTDVAEELEKGNAVRKQHEVWNKLCEWRIKLQKILAGANRLPQYDLWEKFKKESGKPYSDYLNTDSKLVGKLLSSSLDLQDEFLKFIPYTDEASSTENTDKNIDDEEIPSESEEDVGAPQASCKGSPLVRKPKKRKLTVDDYEEFLSKQQKSMTQYRNMVIQNWEEKTLLSTKRSASKQNSFSMFDQSAVKQINQILQDKSRLIKRTQIKRTLYQIFGKSEPSEVSSETGGDKKHDLLKESDPEIFDDDDFYRQLLKDVIESKSSSTDPGTFSRQLEVQRIRNKLKRKVDTKASKGRKIRFDVHPKMLNLMAPICTPAMEMEEDACNELFNSVFGKRSTAVTVT